MTSTYRHLGEAEAWRDRRQVTVRHPAAYPLQGLVQLQHAAKRYGHLLPSRTATSFAAWADRIGADALAGIDPDRPGIVQALREMQHAAQHKPRPALLSRLRDRLTHPLHAAIRPQVNQP